MMAFLALNEKWVFGKTSVKLMRTVFGAFDKLRLTVLLV
jgi:hypothetical protein